MSQTPPTPSAEDCPPPRSPVDIRPQDTDCSALPPLRFRHPARLDMELHYASPKQHCRGCARDNEGTVKAVPVREQKCLLSVGDDTYELEDVHWHTPSEHTVGGVAFPLEQHMKYKREVESGEAEYTVVAVFVHPGQPNDSLDRLLSSARPAEHSKGSWEVAAVQLDTLLPTCTESYRYLGSTTVCPYTPGVRWNVLTHPVQASTAALEHYREVFPKGNALDTQPLGDRRIVSDRHRWW
ncbi:carbonic anhydrase family protein [Streptomyces sp. NPDC002680]|uniref:carbonic anhydrase family protein n=1 Tax=Streptomyces sp. NPDC002680 TaxID=3364659 RepID=UPI0036C2AE68